MKLSSIMAFLEKIPVFGGLVNCNCENHTEAIKELLSTLSIALSPIYLGAFVFFCMDKDNIGYWAILNKALQNGELMIYCTSLLAPVYYMAMSDRYPMTVFPKKLSSIIIATIILMFTIAVFVIQRGGFLFNETVRYHISIGFFIASLVILYVNMVYDKSRMADYILHAFQQDEKDFASQLGKHRR